MQQPKPTRLTRLVGDIFATRPNEIHCEEAAPQLVRCAAARLPDAEAQHQYPALWHHLRLCANCAREYRLLREMEQLTAEGTLDRDLSIPPPPDSGQPSLWQVARDAITLHFPGFSAALPAALTRGEELALEPAEIALDGGLLTLQLDVAVSESDPTRRDLFCLVLASDEQRQADLEGARAWVQRGTEEPALDEQWVGELGTLTFSALPPGPYNLRLRLAGQEYAILDLTLP